MTHHPFSAGSLGALTLVAALAVAGCTSSPAPSASSGSQAAVSGGVLKIVGTADIDHVDPTAAALVSSNNFLRATTRQLISYQASAEEADRIVAQGDLATEVPTPTGDGLIYTFTLREGAMFNTPGEARQITSADVARGIERLCNPAIPAASLGYFQDLIAGMDEYCTGFTRWRPKPTRSRSTWNPPTSPVWTSPTRQSWS